MPAAAATQTMTLATLQDSAGKFVNRKNCEILSNAGVIVKTPNTTQNQSNTIKWKLGFTWKLLFWTILGNYLRLSNAATILGDYIVLM